MPPAERRSKSAKMGRPLTLPPGTRNRTIRLTDAEWDAVRAFVQTIRERAKPKDLQGK
jgi:hypothetical protein